MNLLQPLSSSDIPVTPHARLVASLIIGFALLSGHSHAEKPVFTAIDVSGFKSSIQHWRELRAENRFIEALPDQPSYKNTDVAEIVDNILLYQRANGGWPKDYDMLAILTPEQRASVESTRNREDTSYDNDNIHSQVTFLAHAYSQHPEESWRRACERGLDFMLASQNPSGGFPQRYPDLEAAKSHKSHITFNDGVTIGILTALFEAAHHEKHFEWLDEDRREKCKAAEKRGIECILRSQIVVNGTKTGWCQQHDVKTFEARPGRTFELASICPQETTEIALFLMKQPSPSAQVKAAIHAAAAWLEKAALSGIRIEKVKAEKQSFESREVDFDVVVVPDHEAKKVWARHYDLETNVPVFAGRDGVKKYALKDIEMERRTGTPWYGNWPTQFLKKEYPAWQSAQ